jgi:hypothetical protein
MHPLCRLEPGWAAAPRPHSRPPDGCSLFTVRQSTSACLQVNGRGRGIAPPTHPSSDGAIRGRQPSSRIHLTRFRAVCHRHLNLLQGAAYPEFSPRSPMVTVVPHRRRNGIDEVVQAWMPTPRSPTGLSPCWNHKAVRTNTVVTSGVPVPTCRWLCYCPSWLSIYVESFLAT